ncbi:UvrD-helicase domain-containing protein [Propionivibrio dicarboxylicus]|uniref:DNA 3'-5' helicase n=1 Tax=Propionivibrio dicarboxylicus TaxID=83767 RepID=A0A1G8E561_9RHOO|nr:UvrD-helicase domain-containing protein [Propionivibrio dicarboxylicus]SDH65005.1 ATP-dependent helicase/nuclease subunit A [Propionivibrio dicarboxylicus]
MAGAVDPLVRRALDPTHSVVVEACAGSGKTWLLASRIVRLLLAGVAPGDILAITFTRKAAREIEERVVGWLRQLATGESAFVDAFLAERGVDPDTATRRTARGLYELVLTAQPRLAVSTFHGWFLQLVDAAPLSANLSGATLVDADSRFFDELWQSFAASLQKDVQGELTQRFIALLDTAGLDATRRLLRRAFNRRSEWRVLADDPARIEGRVVDALQALLGAGDPGEALAACFAGDWQGEVQACLGLLEMSETATDARCAAALRAALDSGDAAERFDLLCSAVLTSAGTLRKRELNKAAEKRFTPAGAERLVTLHARLGAWLIDCAERRTAERILAFNRDACAVFAAFLAHVDAFKQARRQIDFVDAEWAVLQLLRDDMTAAFLQARLDARYRHVLLDEFQDTNPLQWQILRAWLDAYSDGARPGLFLVGDPKQSIYRFRRAEPRLFAVASEFLVREFGAVRCEQDVTRRNAPAVIDVVNALFLDDPVFQPFRRQASLAGPVPGQVELLPLFGHDETETSDAEDGEQDIRLRDPLTEPAVIAEDRRRALEADALAARILEIVGRDGEAWQIQVAGAPGAPAATRPARYDDILILVRTRTGLALYERALSAAGIPFDAASRGGLLEALEVADIMALLAVLVTPSDDLHLAQVLRSPLFACDDDMLMRLAARTETGWWVRLHAEVGDTVPPQLARASRFLLAWQAAAGVLPVHDLLDRIFHQGEVIARYRQAVPAAMAAGVEANLRELLLLALDLDGGRYPSLPRFIDALREWRDADSGDAPDEGVIAADGAATGRVRILTIHGAKGLEAPIVWLLGAHAAPRPPDPWDVIVDWAPEEMAPRHFSFFGRKEDRGVARQPIFDAEAGAAAREELNLLYVAITRARQVFIASGIDNARAGDTTPYRLIEAAIGRLGGALVHGDSLPRGAAVVTPPAPPADVPVPALPAIGERREAMDAAERFGVLLHALLERRTAGIETPGWWRALGFVESDFRRVDAVAQRILAEPALRRFFDPACFVSAWNEVDVTGGDGQLQRIDRLVEVDGVLWVLDYKSSGRATGRLAVYEEQVRGYCRIVAAAFPGRPVRGLLIFGDADFLDVAND